MFLEPRVDVQSDCLKVVEMLKIGELLLADLGIILDDPIFIYKIYLRNVPSPFHRVYVIDRLAKTALCFLFF